jgi:hypothetical protein
MRYPLSTLFVLLLFGFTTATISSAGQQSLTAAEIIDKHLTAVGGKQALAKLKSRVAIGTVRKENEPEVRMAIVSESPNRVSAVYVFERFDWQMTYDGKKSFVRGGPLLPRDFSPIQDKYNEMLASGLMFNSISLYNLLLDSESNGVKFEAKGTKKIKDRSAYVVEAKKGKVSARLYFDAENFMWVRTEYGRAQVSKSIQPFTNDSVYHNDDEMSVDFYFDTSDFREADGVKLPFKFEQVVTYPILRQKKAGTLSGIISEYQHNVPIDPKMFQ